MILVDTSVWVDHLHRGDAELIAHLERGEVAMHPMVLGEIACGTLRNRSEVLDLLGRLPMVPTATDAEVLALVEQRQLMGRGLGYVDVHLIAAAMLVESMTLWTRDKRLAAAAAELAVAY